MTRKHFTALFLWLLLIATVEVGEAQSGPYSAQIQRLLNSSNTWGAGTTQTFSNVSVTGTCTGCSGASDVQGPASATDNAIARYDGTTGKLIQNSVVTVADTTGDLVSAGSATFSGGTATLGATGTQGILSFPATAATVLLTSAFAPTGGTDVVYEVRATGDFANADTVFRVTDNAGSVLFLVNGVGNITATATIRAGASSKIEFNGSSGFSSPSNGVVNVANNAADDFTRFNLGTATDDDPGITASAAVSGKSQGIIIHHGDGTAAAFADLGAATNGSMIYCSDCTKATPCAGSGNGALAKRLNGAWDCD